ncbi:MAG: hypothetical protein O2829_01025 [Bacteroidetes bacterium]|nr:hypothetical protein [Bacteroidota bacterium]
MKIKRYFSFLLLGAVLACAPTKEEPALEKLPYFDLKGFIDLEINKLEGDSVFKTSEINGEKQIQELLYTSKDWKEEFVSFYQADINVPSLATAYSTRTTPDQLIHELLPEAKGKVKEITIRYVENYPAWVTFKLKDENMFYQSTTFGEIYLNQTDRKIDLYKIETTQKVLFLSPTNIKISGIIH